MTEAVSQAPADFGNRVRSAVIWRSGTQILSQIVAWGVTMFVMRLLNPSDYGLMAMTQVVTAFLSFLNGWSFASALIRDKEASQERIRQTFGLLILLNGGLALAQYLAAPLAAAYFHQPLVTTLLRWQALIYLPVPFIALNTVQLSRELDFKKQGITNLISAMAGVLASLAMVLAGYGIWTLVAAPIIVGFVRAIGLIIAARLLVWPSFRFAGAGDIVRFGSAQVIAQFFWIIQSQADVMIAGRTLAANQVALLGLYTEALVITQIFSGKFLPPLNEVAYPSYAELVKGGAPVGPAFVTAVRLVMAIALPFYFGLAVTAEPLIGTLLGAKWLPSVPLISIIALAMPFWTLQIMFSPATNALGKPAIFARTNALGALILATCFLIGIHWGVTGLAYGWLIGAPIFLLATARMSLPEMGTDWSKILRALLPNILAAGTMAALVAGVHNVVRLWPYGAQLGLLGIIGVLTYFALLYSFARAELGELVVLITKRRLP